MTGATSWRRVVAAAAVMIIVGQLLAITNDLYLRQNDPADVVLLAILIVLTFFLLRRASWARWTTIVLVTLGGVLYLAGFVLLIAAKASPELASAVPASLRAALTGFIASPGFSLLAISVLISAVLDILAAGMLAFAPSVRSNFRRGASAPSA